MPLERTPPSARSKLRNEIRSRNVKELVDSYQSSGKIGTSTPASKSAAVKQAVAISYAQERRGGKRKRS